MSPILVSRYRFAGVLTCAWVLSVVATVVGWSLVALVLGWIPYVGFFLAVFLSPLALTFVLVTTGIWLVGLVRTALGRATVVPLIGTFLERLAMKKV